MAALDALKSDLLAECADDHVGVWSVVWELRNRLGTSDPVAVQQLTLELIRSLLSAGGVRAGSFTPDGAQFVVWQQSPDQVTDTIRREWDSLGREPRIGEIAYLTTSGG